MEFFERKGVIPLLLFLNENTENPCSKYELEQNLGISRQTLYERIDFLKDLFLIEENTEVGPRKRTEIVLTKKGNEVVSLLVELKKKIE